jgi:dienelactone hydrolase
MPQELRAERSWERAGIAEEEMSWSVGYGPSTLAWVLRSAGVDGPLPGVLALHDHGGIKFFGKEKVADGPQGPTPGVAHLQEDICGGRAFANELAGRGFVVLVHDAFLWGSRRFPMDVMPETILRTVEDFRAARERLGEVPDETELYDVAARHHEHVISKYCALLGTTLAGVIAHEDRLAADYLGSRPDVIPSSIGCVGLPGGDAGPRSCRPRATR